jgi:hypothetical protein
VVDAVLDEVRGRLDGALQERVVGGVELVVDSGGLADREQDVAEAA